MTATTWADRSLPLAERVRLAMLDPQSIGVSAKAHRDELVADVAATDRLARAALTVADYRGMRMELTRRIDVGDTTSLVYDATAWYQTGEDYKDALAAYRAIQRKA